MRIHNERKQDELSLQMLNKIRTLFDNKNWPFADDLNAIKYFDEFCALTKALTSEQAAVFLALSEEFLWIQEKDYLRIFSDIFDDFVSSLSKHKTIIIAPLLPEADFGKSKSSVF